MRHSIRTLCLLAVVAGNAAQAQEPPAPPGGGADLAPGPAASTPEPATPPAAGPTQARAAPAAAPGGGANPAVVDRLDLGTTSITGNQELPKVLYIVPWKRSDLGDLLGRPINTLLDEVLAPVDPEVFERHLSYYESLSGDPAEE